MINAIISGETLSWRFTVTDPNGIPRVPDATPEVHVIVSSIDVASATVEAITTTVPLNGSVFKATVTLPSITTGAIVQLPETWVIETLPGGHTTIEGRCGVSDVGVGGTAWTYTLTNSVTGLPLANARIWITTDIAGLNPIVSGLTDAFGDVTFYLDNGTIYIWGRLDGYDFTNPTSASVADGDVAGTATPVTAVESGEQQLVIEWNAKGTNLVGAITATFTPDPSEDATWGVRRTDTLEQVVASGVALISDGAGGFHYHVTEPTFGLRYEYWIKATDGSNTVFVHTYVNGTPWWQEDGTWGFVKKWYIDESGRTDRVVDAESGDYTDVSCNRIGNAAQRWLDNLFPMLKTSLFHWVTLAANEEMVTLELARYVEGVDVYDADDGTFTPVYWSQQPCGLSPDHEADTALTLTIARAEQTVFGTAHWPLRAIYVYPDETESRVLRVRCAWYQPTLVLDSDKSFWTVNFPEHLVKAMMLIDEGFSRNSSGYNDFVMPLVQDVMKIWHNEVHEEWNSIGREQIG